MVSQESGREGRSWEGEREVECVGEVEFPDDGVV